MNRPVWLLLVVILAAGLAIAGATWSMTAPGGASAANEAPQSTSPTAPLKDQEAR